MHKSLTRARNAAFVAQGGRCYYCNFPMWQSRPSLFAQMHGLSLAQCSRFQCTAEHLMPRRRGGTHSPSNIAAACRYCNCGRHRRNGDLSPASFRRFVLARLASGRWHPSWARHLGERQILRLRFPQAGVVAKSEVRQPVADAARLS
jgi:hypothetical protein